MVERSYKPWERVGFSNEITQTIYRDWGGFFFRRSSNIQIAIYYFNKSLQLSEHPKAFYYLSLCKKYIALCEAAYSDAIRALSLVDLNHFFNINVCDIMYDMNCIEDAGVELMSKSVKFAGIKKEAFYNNFDVVAENLMDSMGDAMWYFIREYRKYISVVTDIRKATENADERPLWKILREKEECDVLSILEEIEPLVHPREQARRNRGYSIFCSRYLNKSAIDVKFLKSLTKNKTLLAPQFESTENLKKILNENYHIVIKFLKMLHARSPLYNEKHKRYMNKTLADSNNKAILFRIRNSTRKNCIVLLNKIKELRKRGNIYELVNAMEEIMGDYIILKTHRILPWKFEFINEVHNTVALAFMDQLVIPANLAKAFPSEEEQLFALMELPMREEFAEIKKLVFGDKSTWIEPEAIDYAYIKYKLGNYYIIVRF